MKEMDKVGIETGIHCNPIHKMSYYKSNIKLPITEKISETILIHPNLGDGDIESY